MAGENLERIEAQNRKKVVSNVHYDIYLDISNAKNTHSSTDVGNETFYAKTTVYFDYNKDTQNKQELFIDLKARSVQSITLNNQSINVSAFADHRIIIPENLLSTSNTLEIISDNIYTSSGEGLHRHYSAAENEVYLYTQFEVADARRVFACFEQPDIKATFDWTVKAPQDWILTSTMFPEEVLDEGDTKVWRFGRTPVMSTYLTSLCAGPFEVWEDSLTNSEGREIKMRVLSRKSMAKYMDAENVFRCTKQGFDFYENLFKVPFPYQKYDQVFMPDFNAGAMENIGNVTYRESYIFDSAVPNWIKERRITTILHELAHMWFGDLVTMKWWDDLWLNESFAEFVSTVAGVEATEENRDGYIAFNAHEKAWGMVQDQLPSTHSVAANIRDLNDVLVNFDGITYAKGAAVLQALVNYVGREQFFEGIKNYLNAHSYKNAEFSDLISELQKVTDKDLQTWSHLWLQTAGINTLTPIIESDASSTITNFSIKQEAVSEHPYLRPHSIKIGFYDFVNADESYNPSDKNITATGKLSLRGLILSKVDEISVDIEGDLTNIDAAVGKNMPALILINDEGKTFAKTRFDKVSKETALSSIHKVKDPLARAMVYDVIWNETRDGLINPADYIVCAFKLAAVEDQSITLRGLLNHLKIIGYTYVPKNIRSQEIMSIGTKLWELARESAPGSDAQLQLFNSFCEFASTDEHVTILNNVLAGTIKLPGLNLDTLLEWNIRIALARLKTLDKASINTAYENNQTHAAWIGYQKALASIESVDNKQKVFDEIINPHNNLTNDGIEALVLGWSTVSNSNIIEDIAPKYFESINKVWDEREFAIAETIIRFLYPSRLASFELKQMAEKWLENNQDKPEALKRIIKENLDETIRALNVQKTIL